MRRLLLLAALAAVVYAAVSRRRRASGPRAQIGYDDGSAVTLEPGAPELEPLVAIAAGALRP